MSEHAQTPARLDLRSVAIATAVVIGLLVTAAVSYLLLDVLLLLFLGIIVAAALQPWHALLSRKGIPQGISVLLIYVLLLVVLGLVTLTVGPLIIEQVGRFTTDIPRTYSDLREWLAHSGSGALRLVGQRIPPLERLAPPISEIGPQLYQGTLGVTTSLVKLVIYVVSVFAIAFYWTIEVARFERLLVSLLPVETRPRALTIWHDIESRLGGFMRGQGLAMLFVGAVCGCGYALIGLPNALALGVLAGLLEAIPIVGPLLAVGPAILVATALGGNTVLAVMGLALFVHLFESNVLIPRIMHRAVGVSYLVSLLALLSFGTLYGVLGVLIAVPMAAVIQVLLDTLVTSAESVPDIEEGVTSPADELRARIQGLRQHARTRLRARSSRMGIDPSTTDHLVDAVDQQIESAAAHIERLLSVVEESSETLPTDMVPAIVETLQGATDEVEHAVEQADTAPATTDGEDPINAELNEATQHFRSAIEHVEDLVRAAQCSEPTPPRRGVPSRRAVARTGSRSRRGR